MAKKKKKFRLRAGYVILAFLLLVCILGGVYLSQETRIETIAAEKATLQSELDKLKVEEERLERTLEYMGTNDYLLQYAREKLGYVYSNDIKFVE
ncbi:MAG: septum formation initiator family protein [Clostridiales bacterium]|nr:septum formation initiator family protein [Clostridia bacterium]MCR5073779.1 septum formation initiator family protein [Clostridiales bacterium]